MAGGSQAYHLRGELELEGEYSVVDFERSIQKAIARHEVLRTVFREGGDGSLRQVVLAESASMFRMSYRDFVGVEEGEVRSYVIEESGREFDLSAGPLLRAGLIRLGSGRYIFHYTLHHIISDGWSMELLGKEVLEYYEGYARGAEVELPALRIQYKDYAGWQQQQLEGELFGAHRRYWMEQFSGEVPVLELPSQRVRPSVFTHRGYYITTVIGRELTEGLRELSRRQNGTLFMGIVASLKALFYRYTGQRDIVIGSPVAGRGHAELEGQIGFYMNTLALRTRLEGEDSFESVLGKVREVTLSAYEHQMYPFDRLVEDLGLRRDMSRSALFDVMVGLQNQGERGTGITEGANRGETAVKFDMMFNFSEGGDELGMQVEYNTDIYDRDFIERMIGHYRNLLGEVIGRPEVAIDEIDYLLEEERRELLEAFNDTAVSYPGVR